MPPYLPVFGKSKQVSLRPPDEKQNEKGYEYSLNALREEIKNQRTGYIDLQLRLPYSVEEVHLQLRCTDLYINGFRGKDGWYDLDGEENGWGQGRSCGVEGNYNTLTRVETVNVDAVDNLRELAYFEKGKELVDKLIVIAAAVVSESLRFANVAIMFTQLFDKKRNEVPVGKLKDAFFVNWADLSQKDLPGVLLKQIPNR